MQEFEHSPAPDHKQYVRRVTLPSGKTIEVISFEHLAAAERRLHICPDCASELVYPIAWEQADGSRWEVSLRCPNCEWSVTDLFEEGAIRDFDETLDRGTQALVDDLRHLTRGNMEEDVERFAGAIEADHVLPEDF